MNAFMQPRRPLMAISKHSLLPFVMTCVSALCGMPAAAEPAKMAIEGRHAMWIDQGNVYAVGDNLYCNITNSTRLSLIPAPLFTGDRKAVSVAVAGLQSAILFADGSAIFRGGNVAKWPDTLCYESRFPMRGITDIALLGGGFVDGGVFFIGGGQVYRWTGIAGDPPQAISGGAGAKSISAGNSHIVVVFCDGSVATWGRRNVEGQLGARPPGATGSNLNANELTKMPLTDVVSAYATGHSSMVQLKDGRVMVWGSLNEGFAPSPDRWSGWNTQVPTPLYAPPANTVKISFTGSTVYALTADGHVHRTGWIDDKWPNGGGTYQKGFVHKPMPRAYDMSVGQHGVVFDLGAKGQRHVDLAGNIYDIKPTADFLDQATGAVVLRSSHSRRCQPA